jgi:hypothetical protein
MRRRSLLRLFVAAKRAEAAASVSQEPERVAGGAGGIGEFSLSSMAAAAAAAEPLELLNRRLSPAAILVAGAADTRAAAAMALALSISA